MSFTVNALNQRLPLVTRSFFFALVRIYIYQKQNYLKPVVINIRK